MSSGGHEGRGGHGYRLCLLPFIAALMIVGCGPRGAGVDMPPGVRGPDTLLLGEWMPHDVQWQRQPAWSDDSRKVATTTALSFDAAGVVRMAMGRFYMGDSIGLGDDLERRRYAGRWRWIDSARAELRYRLVYDDMPIRGEPIPGPLVIDTIVVAGDALLDFDYARGAGGEWKDLLVRVPSLVDRDRRALRGMR